MVGQKRFGRAEWAGLLGVVDDDDAARAQQAGAHFQIEPHEFKIVGAVDEDKVDGRAVCSNCVRKDIELSNEQVVIARSGSGHPVMACETRPAPYGSTL